MIASSIDVIERHRSTRKFILLSLTLHSNGVSVSNLGVPSVSDCLSLTWGLFTPNANPEQWGRLVYKMSLEPIKPALHLRKWYQGGGRQTKMITEQSAYNFPAFSRQTTVIIKSSLGLNGWESRKMRGKALRQRPQMRAPPSLGPPHLCDGVNRSPHSTPHLKLGAPLDV